MLTLAGITLDTVLKLILSLLQALGTLLGQVLIWSKDGLKWALDPKIASGGLTVVAKAWEFSRDFANMFFIVILVGIAFATIFNVFPRFRDWDARKALFGLIIAAIAINFSMAIGQTVVAVSNQVAKIFVDIMPNLGDNLIATLKPQQFFLHLNIRPIFSFRHR